MGLKQIGKLKFVVIVLFSFFAQGSYAQLSKANDYFKQEKYFDAINYYRKVIKKDVNNIEANENIAYSYRKLKDYENAEIYYAKAVELNPSESSNYLYYGQTLKNNEKVREAKSQFEKFVEKNPNSLIGRLMVQSCSDISEWEADPKEFTVSLMDNINSENADFCPLTYEDGIVFVSERGPDLVNENNFGGNNKPYLSIFYARKSKSYKKAKKFSNQLNSIYHDGPVTISADKKTIYFTRAVKEEKGKEYTNRIKIYTATLEGKKWTNVKPFKYSSSQYSIAHPWLSEDGKKLFFASDMPGGKGKMDIYVCNREGDGWSEPKNLGDGVNTPENEVFPYYRDDVLYFSSDGLPGYGGLDVFSVYSTDDYKNAKNLKTPLNSSKDDFGIFFSDDENGYFSSDREGGIGSDDIYSFVYESIEEQTVVNGKLEYDNLPASNAEIGLFDENDELLQTTVTDENGNFKFNKLKMDDSYYLQILNEDDDSLLESAKMYITNANGEKVLVANMVTKGKYVFEALPADQYEELPLLEEEDESLLTVSVFGQLYKELPGDYSGGMEVWVVDDEGNVIGKAITDKDGKFVFEKLSPDEQYLFMLAEDDESLNLIIVDENGNVVESAKRLIDGKYKYVRLDSEQNMITLINELDEVIKIGDNESFVISKIYYDYKSVDVNAIAAKELDKLALILNKNVGINVELTSHTDSKGSHDYNLRLSQQRAEKARAYIVGKGVNPIRISALGLGETKPVAPNENPDGSDNPKGRAKNRRTEFKIIKSH